MGLVIALLRGEHIEDGCTLGNSLLKSDLNPFGATYIGATYIGAYFSMHPPNTKDFDPETRNGNKKWKFYYLLTFYHQLK